MVLPSLEEDDILEQLPAIHLLLLAPIFAELESAVEVAELPEVAKRHPVEFELLPEMIQLSLISNDINCRLAIACATPEVLHHRTSSDRTARRCLDLSEPYSGLDYLFGTYRLLI